MVTLEFYQSLPMFTICLKYAKKIYKYIYAYIYSGNICLFKFLFSNNILIGSEILHDKKWFLPVITIPLITCISFLFSRINY
jgi:hypothetical protein